MKTVTRAVTMNTVVATNDLGDARDRPHTP
jgi:hypothetical protein